MVKNTFKGKIFILFICVMLVMSMFVLIGCRKNDTEDGVYYSVPLTLYYGNLEYVETGDETLEPLSEISWDGLNIPADLEPSEQKSYAYVAAISQLGLVPEGENKLMTAVPENCQLNSITVENGIAYVDLKEDAIMENGMLGEGMFISQVVETLINSFDEIEKVQFLVEGEKVESLGGHWDAETPFEGAVLVKSEAETEE